MIEIFTLCGASYFCVIDRFLKKKDSSVYISSATLMMFTPRQLHCHSTEIATIHVTLNVNRILHGYMFGLEFDPHTHTKRSETVARYWYPIRDLVLRQVLKKMSY